MIKPNKQNIIYWFTVVFQGVSIIITIVNLTYCFITKNTDSFLFSNVALLIPQYYISYGDGIWNIIPLLIFIAITVFLYIKSSMIILGIKNQKRIYITINGFWLILCNISYLTFFTFNTAVVGIPPYCSFVNIYTWIAFIFVYIFVIYRKNNIVQNMSRNMSINTYYDIQKCTYANSFIAFFAIVLAFWMHYFSDMPLSNPTGKNMNFLDCMLYPIFWIINIMLFVINMVFYYSIKKKSTEPLPSEHFLLKINLYQVIPFILSVISFFLTAFVLF